MCVYVFCLLSSCSCTHTHCARRGINCPCSAIVTLLANLQGALKSQPFQGPQYTSKEKPFSPPQVLPYPFPCPVLSTHAAHGRYPATCQEARSSATYRERKLKRNHSARMETDLIQLGTDFAVETTLMKLSSYAQRDPASPGFHALLPLTKYTTTFR